MSARQVRVKVLDGRWEPLEELSLVEGSEMTVVVDLPDAEPPTRRRRPLLRTWNLGLGTRRITREDAYEDTL